MQGFAIGDGWIHNRLNRFKVFAYTPEFADKIRGMLSQIKSEFRLTSFESKTTYRLTGTPEWRFEIGGEFAVENLNLGLLKSLEGLHFLAGLWDADGGWYRPDESHPFGQAKLFGNWHTIFTVKKAMRRRWNIMTGRMSISTRVGHEAKIGDYVIVTRNNVYGTIVRTKSMDAWIQLVGDKLLLKGNDWNRSYQWRLRTHPGI